MKITLVPLLALFILAFIPSCTSTKKKQSSNTLVTTARIAPKTIKAKPVMVRRAIPIEAAPVASKSKIVEIVTVQAETQLKTTTPVKVETAPPVMVQPVATPEILKSLTPLPQVAVQKLKEHENHSLATNQENVTYGDDGEVGYGVVLDEIEDAIREKILPVGTTLPKTMTEAEADAWMHNVTIPTYRSIVRKVVTVPLTLNQEAALTFFCQNQGIGNLIKLVNQPDRLNDGNYQSVVDIMPLYYKDPGNMSGLPKRGNFQVNLFQEPVGVPNNTIAMQ